MSDMKDLVEALGALAPRIPVEVDLWSVREIAAFLKRSEAVVRDRIVVLPDFPPPIQLPVYRREGGSRGHKLWQASEVIEWANSYKSKRR